MFDLSLTLKLRPSQATAVAAVARWPACSSECQVQGSLAHQQPSVKPIKNLKLNSTEIVKSYCGVQFHFRFPRLLHAFLVYLMLYGALNKTSEFHQFVSELLL